MRVTLLGRPGCHLCEQLVEALLQRFPDVPWQIAEADVDTRDDWRRRWGYKIPVLLDEDGDVLSVTELDAELVRAALRRAG